MKLFLGISAVLAWIFAAALLFAPSKFYAPTGMTLTPMLATLAQAHGATLFGLGVIDWMARKADYSGVVAVLTGNLVVQILSLMIVLRTMQLGAGSAVAPGVVIHVTLGSLFLYFLWKTKKVTKGLVNS